MTKTSSSLKEWIQTYINHATDKGATVNIIEGESCSLIELSCNDPSEHGRLIGVAGKAIKALKHLVVVGWGIDGRRYEINVATNQSEMRTAQTGDNATTRRPRRTT